MRNTATALLIAILAIMLIYQTFLSQQHPILAAQDSPIMSVIDERDAGAKEAASTIYILWPNQRKVESYSSGSLTFTTVDFASRKVVTRSADVNFDHE